MDVLIRVLLLKDTHIRLVVDKITEFIFRHLNIEKWENIGLFLAGSLA